MTPTEAHSIFADAVRRIMESGVEIRGLNVSAVEFHPPGTPPFIPTTPATTPPDLVSSMNATMQGFRAIAEQQSGEQAALEAFEQKMHVDLEAHPTPASAMTGDVCAKCGSDKLVWAGACKVCRECGESGGCS